VGAAHRVVLIIDGIRRLHPEGEAYKDFEFEYDLTFNGAACPSCKRFVFFKKT
jgi:hypothetical protein